VVQVAEPKREAEIPPETLEWFGGDELRARVFIEKYALKDRQGRLLEKHPPEMWRRVARELASVERDEEQRRLWEERFYWLLEDFRFVPGGRIMFGAGNPRKVTLLNCYYIPIKEDSIEGIYTAAMEMARTYSYGGGVGVDVSILRPKGSPVNNSAMSSTGAVSFMELYSLTTGTIGQHGRRGALMITIEVSHPDVLEFITIKNDPERRRVRYANISVKVSDEFMQAVERDDYFELRYESDKVKVRRQVKAREVWRLLVENAWASAEPGVIFWDTVKRESPTEYDPKMAVKGVNPCSEQALEDYGCCNLGNINLTKFVLDPFTEKARIDYEGLERAVRYGVRFLDNVLDYNKERHPLPQQREASLYSRRVGLGITGLADMFVMLGVKYDSPRALELSDELFSFIKNVAYDESANLAKEKGPFPGLSVQEHLKRPFVQRLDPKVLEKIRAHGLRNACLLTIPPVGSGSVLAGVTSGIEPIFDLVYIRRSESLSKEVYKVYHPLVKKYMELHGLSDESQLPDYFITAHRIDPEFRVRLQATIQKHIDAAISSTVNLPEEATPEYVEKIYFLGWKLGLKGITVYREGSREGILLTTKAAEARKLEQKRTRDFQLEGATYKFRTELGNLYITVNKEDGEPFEVFVQIGKTGSTVLSLAEAIGRLVSLALRSGIKADEVIEQLKDIKSVSVRQDNGMLVHSIPDAIAKALELSLGRSLHEAAEPLLSLAKEQKPEHEGKQVMSMAREGYAFDICPVCGNVLYKLGSCLTCGACGFSTCP